MKALKWAYLVNLEFLSNLTCLNEYCVDGIAGMELDN